MSNRDSACAGGNGTSVDLGRIATVLGSVPRVAYEAAHVYPLSAPMFRPAPAALRPRPARGPLKLYVHVPFCNYACRFCFYAKRVGTSRLTMERYVGAVLRELETVEEGTPLEQLYVGGGTPTVLPADLLDNLLTGMLARVPARAGTSRTVESSPESLSAEHVRVLRARGIERASLGVQTMNDAVLEAINRGHTGRQSIEACELLVGSGLFVNVDLIYGLPGQSEESFRSDLAALASCRPDSFTIYDLRLNESTPLANAMNTAGDRFDLAALMRWRVAVASAARDLGYVQTRWHTFVRDDHAPSSYERAPCVDGFAAGRQLGLGVSSVSHLGDTIYRNCSGLEPYLARMERGESPVDETFPLDGEDCRTLFVVRSLGDGRGLQRSDYEQAFESRIDDDFAETIERLVGAELLCDDGDELSLTATGRLLYDLVTIAFYPPRARRWLGERQC